MNFLDIDFEMQNNEFWQGNPQATKEHLDEIIKQKLWIYKDYMFKEELTIEKIDDPDFSKRRFDKTDEKNNCIYKNK